LQGKESNSAVEEAPKQGNPKHDRIQIRGRGGGGEREGEQQFIAFTYEWDVIKH
jgi:hypothetical protein